MRLLTNKQVKKLLNGILFPALYIPLDKAQFSIKMY